MFNKKIGIIFIIISILGISIYIYWYSKMSIIYKENESKDYFGKLIIPKIKINNIIYKIDNPENNVNKNIFLVNDADNYIILAAHSGSSPISYFNKLHKLKKGDQLMFEIKNRKRKYEVFKYEQILKTGKAKIKRYNYPILVLITCSKENTNYQIIYYTRLISSEKISKIAEKSQKSSVFCDFLA